MSKSVYKYLSASELKLLNFLQNSQELSIFSTVNKCIIQNCSWKGFLSQLPKHFKMIHENFLLTTPSEISISNAQDGTFIYFWIQDEVFFKLVFEIYEKQASLQIEHLGYDIWNDRISYEVVLHNGLEKFNAVLSENSRIVFFNKCHTFLVSLDITVDDSMKTLYKKVRENCICSNCNFCLTPPIYQCSNGGEYLCADCAGFINYCKFCKNHVDEFRRMVLLEDEIMRLQISCRHCQDYTSSPADICWHEIDCKLRKLKCLHCEWEDSIMNYPAHTKDFHAEFLFIENRYFEFEDKPFNAIMFRYGVVIQIITTYDNKIAKKIKIVYYGPPQFIKNFGFKLINKITEEFFPQPEPVYTLDSAYYLYSISYNFARIAFQLFRC